MYGVSLSFFPGLGREAILRVQGWEVLPWPATPKYQRPTALGVECRYGRPYATDAAAALELLEEMRAESDCRITITLNTLRNNVMEYPKYTVSVSDGEIAYSAEESFSLCKRHFSDDNLARAICYARLWYAEARASWLAWKRGQG